jgi:hypothetical protein
MKNKIALILILGVVFLITNSCNKSESGATLTATIDGTAYAVNGTSITYSTAVSGSSTYYTFTVSFGAFTLYIYLPSLKAGTYNYSTSYNPGPGMLLSGGNNETYTTVIRSGVPAHGSIVISSNTGSAITGTFFGTLYPQPATSIVYTDSTTVAEGVFNNMSY